MPPIFLHQKIDDESGRTSYDVIDGKQRLTAITEFVDNKFSVMSEDDEEAPLAGLYFKQLTDEHRDAKAAFWRYVIPIEYVDTDDKNVIDSIFDRLNRNGEPLNGQELRQAKYHGCKLLETVHRSLGLPFWQQRTEGLDKSRMEAVEFVSELLFFIKEGSVLQANQQSIDSLYDKYHDAPDIDYGKLSEEFARSSKYMDELGLDYDALRIGGVSHVYGIFSFCHEARLGGNSSSDVRAKVRDFFEEWKRRAYDQPNIADYKASMSSRTKSKLQREKRKNALNAFVFGS